MRLPTYLGPKCQVTPDSIARFEREGVWAAEEKRDGCWAEIRTDGKGAITSITSRVGKLFGPAHVEGLVGLVTHLPHSVLVAELESASEAATTFSEALGYKRVHVFDALTINSIDCTGHTYDQRRRVVTDLVGAAKDPAVGKRLCVVRQATSDFQHFYDDVMADGGEGLVFKQMASRYKPANADGKVDGWIRCKAFRFVDYVVLEIGKSPGGSPNLQVGLCVKGKIKRICTIKTPPEKVLAMPDLIGSVIECKGAEVFKSGALRHGHFERLRSDKLAEDCTLAAARSVGGA